MTGFELESDRVRLVVTETGGQLGEVVFELGGRELRPMHTAPWEAEELPGVPPMLQVLRGDFFAAPFGDSDVLEEDRPHGTTANGRWSVERRQEGRLELKLDGTVLGATVRKTVELRPGQPVVYQRHVLMGGKGRLPIGHHAMLRAESGLRLSFAPWSFAGTPPQPVELPPRGRSLLAYPQRFTDLTRARLADGGETDLTRYPTLESHEDLWMLSRRAGEGAGWTAAVCEREGWAWFALKDDRVLPSTVVWLSNGGRDYPPFSGRHKGVIGLEEVCAYFHLGHRASLEENELHRQGIPTSVELDPERPTIVNYLFGLAQVPSGFGAVQELITEAGAVVLRGSGGEEARVECDPGFLEDFA